MQKQIAVRLILGLLAIAALFVGYQWFAEFAKDPDLGKFDSQGMVLALAYDRQGDHAVLFPEEGEPLSPPDSESDKENFRDTEATWSADGQRIFLSSNRKTNSFSVHRWNPSNNKIDIKRLTSRYQSSPYFDPYNDPNASQTGLILSGGYVLEYDVRTGSTSQILPPVLADRVQNADGGFTSPMESFFKDLGNSFRKARWANGRSVMYAVMRGDVSDVGIVNLFTGELTPPRELIRGADVDLSVSPDGRAVFTVRNFRIRDDRPFTQEEIEAGALEKPFENGILIASINEEGQPQLEVVVAAPDNENVFADVAISPDGSQIVAVFGSSNEEGEFAPLGLVVMPLQAGGGSQGGGIVQGNVRQPSWSPDGSQIVYIKSEGNNSNVYKVDLQTGRETKVSPDGRYGFPRFSPQTSSN